jgi:hypothetical protein
MLDQSALDLAQAQQGLRRKELKMTEVVRSITTTNGRMDGLRMDGAGTQDGGNGTVMLNWSKLLHHQHPKRRIIKVKTSLKKAD